MTNDDKIKELKHKIVATIAHLIDNDYIYIDLPYHSNIGDTLIWQGTMDFVNSLPYKCLYRSAFSTYQKPAISKDIVILLHGGGNFGDFYRAHSEFRNRIIQEFPNNKIIILPQTIYYEGHRALVKDASIMRRHKNLHVCARDQYSYDFLKRYGFSKNIYMVPDMAFCIDLQELKTFLLEESEKTLLFQRIDKEKTSTNGIVPKEFSQSMDVYDWPGYAEHTELSDILDVLITNKRFVEADKYANETYLPQRVIDGVHLISQYSRIYSNRLHGAILSILLGKEVTIIDNSYGKNVHYYNTWLQNVPSIHIYNVKHPINVKHKINQIFAWVLVKTKLSEVIMYIYNKRLKK